MDIYKQINDFINSQDNIEEDDLIIILEMMIDKIICNKANFLDYQVIENNYLWSPFKHLSKNDNKYKNISLINKFLNELKDFKTKQKVQLSQGFLINLYNISNEEIRELIKEFMLNIDTDSLNEPDLKDVNITNIQNFDFDGLNNYEFKISFKLFLAIQKIIEIDENFIEEIQSFPEKQKSDSFFLGQITGQIRYLVEEMQIGELQELLSTLLKLIDELNERQKK